MSSSVSPKRQDASVKDAPSKEQLSSPENSTGKDNSYSSKPASWVQQYPLLNNWSSRRAFVKAQIQVLGILAIALVMNNWPVSYPREENHSNSMFWMMNAALAVVAYFTTQHVPSKRGVQFLSRAQTEEWKGWMQWAFIMYHYYRNRDIYNEIRVFVSAYVWMTGFGNFQYFDKKQDFSLERMVSMWVRINYFPLMLSIFLNVKLELYYVVPLHTMGFFMTAATCYGAKMLRDKKKFDAYKANVAAIGICLLCHVIFYETNMHNMLQWISHEYYFRFGTDKYSAWFGVLCGFMWTKLQAYMQWCYGGDSHQGGDSSRNLVEAEQGGSDEGEPPSPQGKSSKPENPKKLQAMYAQRGLGVFMVLFWYFVYGTETDKHLYNPIHPFVFWLPLCGYLMIRNSSKYLTELHSTVLEFMGRITLETYVLQFHVFMSQNVQNIPIVIPGSGPTGFAFLKFANMLICGAGFFTLAWYARRATVVTQEAIAELVADWAKSRGWASGSDEDDESSNRKKPTLGIIDEDDDSAAHKHEEAATATRD